MLFFLAWIRCHRSRQAFCLATFHPVATTRRCGRTSRRLPRTEVVKSFYTTATMTSASTTIRCDASKSTTRQDLVKSSNEVNAQFVMGELKKKQKVLNNIVSEVQTARCWCILLRIGARLARFYFVFHWSL